MAASRYWRVSGLQVFGSMGMELSAVQLFKGSERVDMLAVLSASHAPVAGAVEALQDEDLSSTCLFSEAAVRSGGFALTWDFGVSAEVTSLRLGAGGTPELFPISLSLQRMDSTGRWSNVNTFGAFPWPGAHTLTGRTSALDVGPETKMLLLLADDLADSAFPQRSFTAGGVPPTIEPPGGMYGNSLRHSGSGFLQGSPLDGLALAGDFTIELFAAGTAYTSFGAVLNAGASTDNAVKGWAVELSLRGLVFTAGGANRLIVGGGYVADGLFRHYAITRKGSTLRACRAGEIIATAEYAEPIIAPWLIIGAWDSAGSFPFVGYQKGIRLTAACLYDGPYTPPQPSYLTGDIAFNPLPIDVQRSAPHIAGSSPAAQPSLAVSASQCAKDIEFGGQGRYPFKVEGLPGSQKAKVSLLRARDKVLARETWSAADGAGSFTGLDVETKFIAVAQDPAGGFHPCGAEHFPELPETTGGA